MMELRASSLEEDPEDFLVNQLLGIVFLDDTAESGVVCSGYLRWITSQLRESHKPFTCWVHLAIHTRLSHEALLLERNLSKVHDGNS